jgi:hypothetical protein
MKHQACLTLFGMRITKKTLLLTLLCLGFKMHRIAWVNARFDLAPGKHLLPME